MMRQAVQHIPAGMSAARLLAIPWIVYLAWRGERGRCCAALAGSVAVDLADGILARRIGNPIALRRQRRLDGVADAVFFVAAPLCALRLRPTLAREEWLPLSLFGLCQGLSLFACQARFGRLPRYHTRAYKWSAGSLACCWRAGCLAGALGSPSVRRWPR